MIGPCPVCRARSYGLLDYLVAPPVFSDIAPIVIGAPVYPMIMLACGNCGHIHFHSAVMMGVVSLEDLTSGATTAAKRD